MLILTRRIGERVMIGDDITVIILRGRGSQIQLGIHAPRGIPIHRAEIYERIRRKQEPQGQRAIEGEVVPG